MNNNQPKLQFLPGSSSGFTPAGISGFSDLKPAAIVRELIQNSLDAAIEANVRPAEVIFRLACIETESIPGIKEYEEAFRVALDFQKKKNLNSPAERVVDVIKKVLKNRNQDVLSVRDNGIGLDHDRINALLSDGVSDKGGEATGTFGNGHSTVLPTSDLRYVLYGGINSQGERIGAGHAVLASSHKEGEKQPTSGDGYFIIEPKDGEYVCAVGKAIPSLIANFLDTIKKHQKSGTVVVVPAFNYFRKEREKLWDLIQKSAAHSFAPAIDRGQLIIKFEDHRGDPRPDQVMQLGQSNLKSILEKGKDDKRKIAGDFMSGSRAFSAYNAFHQAEAEIIRTEVGQVEVRLLKANLGTTHIDLFRNGMWITDERNIPLFSRAFSDREPFQAVLLLDSTKGGDLYELVRSSEGPLHNKLHHKEYLSRENAKRLKKAFSEIRQWLLNKVPKIKSVSFTAEDFLAIDFGEGQESGNIQRTFWGTPTLVNQRVPVRSYAGSDTGPAPANGSGSRPGRTSPPRPRPLVNQAFNITSVELGTNKKKIHLVCRNSVTDAHLQLCVDENLDATCDRGFRRDTILKLSKVRINNKMVDDKDLLRQNGHIMGVYLGDIPSDSVRTIEVTHSLPNGLILPPNQSPTLRIDLLQGSSRDRNDGS